MSINTAKANFLKKPLKYYKSLLSFYIEILFECFFFPVLFVRNFIMNKLSVLLNKKKHSESPKRKRVNVLDENVLDICIHEWGGYNSSRKKSIRGREFICGLKYQVERIRKYTGNLKLNTVITMSDIGLYKDIDSLNSFKVMAADNAAMDFSGYSAFVKQLPEGNRFVLLMNSSVSARQIDFLDDYINYFKNDLEIGMLGISYSSKSYQTFLKNNFKPHIQSFFILTTSDVLRGIIKYNNGFFPGSNSSYKLSIIKKGEMRLSKIVLKLGYKISVVTESGKPFTFYKNGMMDNGYGRWTMPLGDCRLYVENINSINQLKS